MPTARIFRPRSRSCWRRAADETVAAGCLLACRGTDGLRPQTRRALRPALHARTGQVCRDGRDRCGTAPLCLRHGGFEDLHQRTAQPRTGTRGVWPWDVGRFRRSSSCDHLCPGAVSPDGRGNLLRPAGDRAARQLLYLPLSGLRRHCGQPVCWRNVEGANISNSAGHDKDKLHATILFLRWMRNMFSDYVDDPELISALQCYIHTILRISLHKHYNICGLWGVSMALGRFNKRAAFTTFFRNFRLFS